MRRQLALPSCWDEVTALARARHAGRGPGSTESTGQGVRKGSTEAEFGFKLIKKYTSTLRFLVEFL